MWYQFHYSLMRGFKHIYGRSLNKDDIERPPVIKEERMFCIMCRAGFHYQYDLARHIKESHKSKYYMEGKHRVMINDLVLAFKRSNMMVGSLAL